MNQISLREYIREIENLIDGGANEEAIAHCRHILNQFPKCIVAYQNLAKALLENKNYPQAKDIFTRVLSVFPDDFVAHVGLSIILESEGNLNGAITHMERAYDVQPSNPAITEELRRLFSRRDGVLPPRIRMTRGALIRMYARGELFQQAISECQSVLADDPGRFDLQVILAQMYYQSSAYSESREVSTRILAHLPYCYEANSLLWKITSRSSNPEQAELYKKRLEELDPYFAHITSPDQSPDDIPGDVIMVDHYHEFDEPEQLPSGKWPLSNQMDLETTKQRPGYEPFTEIEDNSAIVGITSLNSPEDEATPSDSIHSGDASVSKLSDSESEYFDQSNPYPDEIIPDWMRKAGWTPVTTGNQMELDNSTSAMENNMNDAEVEPPSEMPEWFHSTNSLASDSKISQSESVNGGDTPEGNPEFLDSSFTNQEVVMTEPSDFLNEETSDPRFSTQTPKEGETGDTMPSDSLNKNEEEWLNQFRDESPDKGEQNDLPDWLKEFESENEQPLEENLDMPEWLKSLEPAEPEAGAVHDINPELEFKEEDLFEKAEEESPAVTSTSYLFTRTLSEEETASASSETAEPVSEAETGSADIEQPLENPVETPAEPAGQTSHGLPSWVRNILKRTAPAEPSEPAAEMGTAEAHPIQASEITAETPAVETIPTESIMPPPLPVTEEPQAPAEVVAEEPIQDLSSVEPAGGVISEETNAELLDWLRGFGGLEGQPTEPTPSETVPATDELHPETVSSENLDRLESFAGAETDLVPPVNEEVIPESSETVEEITAISEEPIPAEEPTAMETPQEVESMGVVGPDYETAESWVEEEPQSVEAGSATIESQPEEATSLEFENVAAESEVSFVPEEGTGAALEEPVMEAPLAEEAPSGIEEVPSHPVVPNPLEVASHALEQGDLHLAANEYTMALQDDANLPELIDSLKSATQTYEDETDLWQLLGDAYARSNQFGEAFKAYEKAENLLLKA